MKKLVLIISLLFLFTTINASAETEKKLYLETNGEMTLNLDFLNGRNETIDENPNKAFVSSDESIVTIDENGIITAQGKEGAAIIYIGVNGVETSVKVIVSDNPEEFDYDLYFACKYLIENQIMVGDETGNFNSNKEMTRAEFAKIICKFADRDYPFMGANFAFDDVSEDFWGYNYIMNAYDSGLLLGYGNKTFGINDTLTEEQAITVLCRMLGDTYEDVSYIETSVDEKGGYSEGYISIAGERGIDIDGLQKTVPATRARVAKWLYQLYNIKNSL